MKGLDAVATFLLFSIVKSQNILQEELVARIEQFVQGTAYDITQCGSVHTQVLRLYFNDTAPYFCEEAIQESVDDVKAHKGGVDFNLNAYSWLLIKFWNHPLLVAAGGGQMKQSIVDAITNIPMWCLSATAYEMRGLTAVSTLLLFGNVYPQNVFQEELAARVLQYVQGTAYNINECGDIHTQVLRLNFNDTAPYFCEAAIQEDIVDVNSHECCLDFSLNAYPWLLIKFWNHPLLVEAGGGQIKQSIVDALTNLPMWVSDEGDLNSMQYWSENHYATWNAAAYLIGYGFETQAELQNVVFNPSGLNGAGLRQAAGERVREWLDYRIRFGFGEYNSETYGKIVYFPLIVLSHLAPDEDIRVAAEGVRILLEFDQIIGSVGDRLASARGRAASSAGKIGERHDQHIFLPKAYGDIAEAYGNRGLTYTVLNYLNGRMLPSALMEIGKDVEVTDREMRQRFQIGTEEGPSEDLDVPPQGDGPEVDNCWFWFANGGYFSPDYPECLFLMGDKYDLWDRQEVWENLKVFKPIWDNAPGLVGVLGQLGEPFGNGAVLGPANMYTYRTKDFMMSSVQDYKGGHCSGQQQPWQVTYDIFEPSGGTLFTHQPYNPDPGEDHRGDYWMSGILPKLGQYGTTVVSMFNPENLVRVLPANLTHAFFNLDTYDESDITLLGPDGGWVFGRYQDFYVGLYSAKYAYFAAPHDLVSPGLENVWIAEVGSASLNGTFDSFKKTLSDSLISVDFTREDRSIRGSHNLEVCRQFSRLDPDAQQTYLRLLLGATAIHVDPHTLASKCESVSGHQASIDLNYVRGDGRILEMSWDGPLTVDGSVIESATFKRYDNDYSQVEWGSQIMQINSANYNILIDFPNGNISFD